MNNFPRKSFIDKKRKYFFWIVFVIYILVVLLWVTYILLYYGGSSRKSMSGTDWFTNWKWYYGNEGPNIWMKYSRGDKVIITFTLNWVLLFFFSLCGFNVVWDFSSAIVGLFAYKSLYKTTIENTKNIRIPQNICVALVVPVRNDFMKDAILHSFKQTYKNCKRYILDDSTDVKMIKEIDKFCLANKVICIRRDLKDHKFNCGLAAAFDNFIKKTINDWDYMVHIDSGDVLCPQHVEKIIPIFLCNNKIGICVPSGIEINSTRNIFSNIVSIRETIGGVCGVMHTYSVNRIMSGAGATYSATALKTIGTNWPDCLSEDGAVSYELIKRGWWTYFTNIVHNAQLNPNNYVVYNKRNMRWDIGAYEMLKKGYYNVSKYPNLDTPSKIIILFSGFSIFFKPLFLLTWFLCIWMFFIYDSKLLYMPIIITGLLYYSVICSCFVMGISHIRNKEWKKLLLTILYAIFFPFLYAGYFFKFISTWIKFFTTMWKKPKFIVTVKRKKLPKNTFIIPLIIYLFTLIIFLSAFICLWYFVITDYYELSKNWFHIANKKILPKFFMCAITVPLSQLVSFLFFLILSILNNKKQKKEFLIKNISFVHPLIGTK